jgi:carbamoyltransferase
MLILGIWDGHDSGAALIRDGEILFAANEERFTRKKLEIDFPRLSIRSALEFAGITPADIPVVAVSTADFAKTLTRTFPSLKRRYYQIRRRKFAPTPVCLFSKKAKYVLTGIGPSPLTRWWSGRVVRKELAGLGFKDYRLFWAGHHESHVAASIACSGFESGLFLSLDGIGDGLSGMLGTFDGPRLSVLERYGGRDSLGIFFEHVTNLLNMRELEDEGKVMALASFAYPIPDEDNPLLDFFTLDGLKLKCRYGPLKLYRKLHDTLWQYPSEQFAYMAQRVLEHNILRIVERACDLTGRDRLVYAGGVASNIKVNMILRHSPKVRDIFIFPHMGDGGLALGAAVLANRELNGIGRYPLDDVFLGPDVDPSGLDDLIRSYGLPFEKPPDILSRAAELIHDGHIILWFRGRMEYGPRALGHRSILARPDSAAVKNRLNVFLKKRVWYQPFCPTMLELEAAEMLADYNGVNNPFMTMGYMAKEVHTDALTAVINADNSCRPQILAEDGSAFAALLGKVKALTGRGVVLNTSLNQHGQPILNTPREALELLKNSRFQYLILEDYLVWTEQNT